tara:strand:+ start:2649 stop:3344 length:696 start_codon:yes stop_codon:yes gene_type:complete
MLKRKENKVYLEEHNLADIVQWVNVDSKTDCITFKDDCPYTVKLAEKNKTQIRCWTLNPARKDEYKNGNLYGLQTFGYVVLGKNKYPGKREYKTTCGNPNCINPNHIYLPEKNVVKKSNKLDALQYYEDYYALGGIADKNLDYDRLYLDWLAKSPAIKTMVDAMHDYLNDKGENWLAERLFAHILLNDYDAGFKVKQYYRDIQAIDEARTSRMSNNLRSMLKSKTRSPFDA